MNERDITLTLELVKRAQGGEKVALDKLLQRYYERVRKIVRLRLGPKLRNYLDSGDILQDTFLAAVRGFDQFQMNDEGSMINWLALLAERQIVGAARYHGAKKRNRDKEIALESAMGEAGPSNEEWEPEDEGTRPMDRAATQEERLLVELCIQKLPEQDKEVIILREYAGCSWKTIAEQAAKPSEGAARRAHAAAMLKLSKLMQNYNEAGAGD